MKNALVAVGIGNTTITFGVRDSNAGSTLPDTVGTNSDTVWSQQATVETAGFDPSCFGLEISAEATWRVASVHRPSEQRLADWIRDTYPAARYRNLTYTDLPIAVDVQNPERVGMDRLVAAVAVNQLRNPGSPAVIVDAGTAITVDLVNPAGHFLGGAILPGLRLISQALASKTDQLPRVDWNFQGSVPEPLGTSTETAIRSGLFWGSVGAIRELVARIGATASGSPQVYLTGGDAEKLASYISDDAVYVKDLVLRGILAAAGE